MYEDSFGLRTRPFGVTPDPGAFYTNRIYAEAEANLLYGIRERRGFVLLTGEVGTGKTTVLRRVMAQLSGEIPFVLVFHTNLSFDEILTFICHELAIEIPPTTRLAQIEALNDFLLEQMRQGRTTAILVDEAHNLTNEALEALRLLSNLETNGEKLLQIVLAGQPELESRLDGPDLRQLRQRIALRCRLERLEPHEVGAYVRTRLRCAGATNDELFAPEAIARIGLYSKGTPRLVNMICDNALLIAYATQRQRVTPDVIVEVADDLRLREAEQAAGGDLVGLESALQGLERAATRPYPEAPPRARDLSWAILLVGLFVAAGMLAASSLRGETRHVESGAGVGVDAPALAGPAAEAADPETGAGTSLASLGASGEEPSRSSPDATLPEPAPPPAGGTGDASTVVYVVPSGATAWEVASAAYGRWHHLGLDLMEEANPEIEDLDWIAAGQRLRLPAFGRETLVRRGPDGTAAIVLASYASAAMANRFATHALRRSGYDVRVVPRRVSGEIRSHRVEIVGLPPSETERAWQAAAELGLLPAPAPAFHARLSRKQG